MKPPMNALFTSGIDAMNRIKKQAHYTYIILSLLRAGAVGAVIMALWTEVMPDRPLMHIVIGITTFLAITRFSNFLRDYRIKPKAMLVGLDMQYPQASVSPFIAAESEGFNDEWAPRLQREQRRVKAFEARRITTLAGSLLIPLLIAALLVSTAPINMTSALADAKNVFSALAGGVTLEVLEGAAPAKNPNQKLETSFALSSLSPPIIDLIPSNMIKLTIVRLEDLATPPTITLESLNGAPPLTIQMSNTRGTETSGTTWTAEFSIANSSLLKIPVESSRSLAKINVQELPLPKVQLSIESGPKDPWPDNELLPLAISVTATHPLDKIRLNITAKGKSSQESVLTITGDTTTVKTSYKLNLVPWMEEDIVEFDIVAEAIDRADPTPLTGRSPAIRVRAASAYGRYRASLETLKKVKSMLDEASSSGGSVSKDAVSTMQKAIQQSETAPFFDGIDRTELARLMQKVNETSNQSSPSKIQDTSQAIGEFLLEHEILDDRERDRDFFIAIRSFSRVLDGEKPRRIEQSTYLANRLIQFLDDRHKRWASRVARLGREFSPENWERINGERPFHKQIQQAAAQAADNPKIAQGHLSKAASEFRAWIEELESKEDLLRSKMERERQQGLANARNDLKEIQQRQDQISQALDRAAQRPTSDLSEKWPAARTNENTNVKQSTTLLNRLRELSPQAGERLEAAIKAMNETITTGESAQFTQAEGLSDLAGRMLRDAASAASSSQKQQKDRGRRRKNNGDDYHGNSIGGQVEIKSEYRVDPKFREEILRDVEGEMNSEENRNILDGWLRQVVR